MSTVARLVLTYFTRTAGLRWLTFVGLATLVVTPPILPRIVADELATAIAFFGGVALFLGTALMPMMVARMARSHAICVLPHGRLKLFLSALITVAIVSFPIPLYATLGQLAMLPPSIAAHYTTWQKIVMGAYSFGFLYVSTFLVATWLYLPIGIATTERNLAGLTKSLLLIIAIIYVPSQRIVHLDPKVELTLAEVVLTWAGIGAGLAFAHRPNAFEVPKIAPESARYAAGREVDLLLGTSRPWLLALAILFPIAIQMLIGFQLDETWLLYFTLFGAVCGGLTGRAAERSRSLWLRARWSREELFARVEAAFWKHNSGALVVLAVLLVAVAGIYDLPAHVVPLGLPLLVFAMTLSTYVGLMMTRGLRWPEASLAIAVVVALMGVAVYVSGHHDERIAIAFEIVFAVLAIVLRFSARRRWHQLDWTLCRPDRAESARTAARGSY